MSRLEQLRNSRQSYSVSFLAFIKIVATRPSDLVCFFEGKDVKYYGPRLRMLRPNLVWQSVDCGGKDAVLKLYDLISSHQLYRKANVAYFLDRDYSLTTIPDNRHQIYCTPCYSVENLYVSSDVFEEMLQGEFGLSRLPDDEHYFSTCVLLFETRLTEFLDAAQVLDTWVFCHREKEVNENTRRILNVDEIKLPQLFSVTLERVQATYTIFDLEAQSGCETPVTEEEFIMKKNRIRPDQRSIFFRGKFLLFFMRTFLHKLAEDAGRDDPHFFPVSAKGILRPSDRNFLSELSQYARTPPCLREFLSQLANYSEMQTNEIDS